ncbi:dihydroneopterin aldolase [Limnohabitans radicicola]|uniref:dihydroneopterin aldolase n=1 Tax=Limnohabitans radicicola TaxID=2771427 RepID=A0A927FHE1_9BURK|nr:dihydroneopterin aldolase [Limnohabitans radicicola]MBD8049645.1 dihydroneopterin aldolase [Limnohabitans radicicola]
MSDVLNHLALHCRRLFLRNHTVDVRIGAHDFEKHAPQRIVFNVELFVPYSASTPTQDDLAEVVDYDFIREVIARRVAQGHIVLQETLCDDLMRELIAHPQVQAVRLSTCKPDVYPDCEGVGVEIFQTKLPT